MNGGKPNKENSKKLNKDPNDPKSGNEEYVVKNGLKIKIKRYFNKKEFRTFGDLYKDKITAKATVLFLKTKDVDVKARVIQKNSYYLIYFDKSTYNEIKYGKLKIPPPESIPKGIKEMIKKGIKKYVIKKEIETMFVKGHASKVIELKTNNLEGKTQTYQILKLEKDVPLNELLESGRKNNRSTIHHGVKSLNKDKLGDDDDSATMENLDDESIGIEMAVNSLVDEFFKKCPKCGGEMEPTFIILGGRGRMSVYKCKICHFYLPRKIV